MKNEEKIIDTLSLILEKVTDLDTSVTGLKTDVSILKTDVSELKTDVSLLKTDVSELKLHQTYTSKRLDKIEENQTKDKSEILARVSSFEANSNLNFAAINNTLSHERIRIDAIYEERKNVSIKFSRKMIAANTFFAGFIAFCVSFFVK